MGRRTGHDGTGRRDKYRGALLGTAIGDALGAPFEGQATVDLDGLAAWAGAETPLCWTDDTHMLLGVAESLLECGGFDGPHMAGRLAANWRAEPWRGYGAGPPQVFQALEQGVAWDEAARRLFEGQGSLGNGAAMRVAAVALAAGGNRDRVVALARQTAQITHAHELGQQGAALQACAVAWLLEAQPSGPGWHTDDLLEGVRGAAPAPPFQRRLDALAQGAVSWSARDAVAVLGNGIQAPEAVPAALFAFLGHPRSFPDAVQAAVRLGGDTDTIAAMTGALAGALHGASSIPAAWLARLEAADRLAALADGLLTLSGR